MVVSHCYRSPVVKNGNFPFLLTSNGQEWQFHIATDVQWSSGNFTLLTSNGLEWHFTLLLTSSGQELLLHIATDI